jgi:hypothetical protein
MSAPEAAVANRENATSPLFAGHYPSSKVVTPNTRSSRNGGIAPVYMRAVSNTGTSPRSCANATASRLMLGTSRKIFPPRRRWPAKSMGPPRRWRGRRPPAARSCSPCGMDGSRPSRQARHRAQGRNRHARASRSRRAGTRGAEPETPSRRTPLQPPTGLRPAPRRQPAVHPGPRRCRRNGRWHTAKQASSARPGFQPSAAAQFTAIEISSGRIVRMLRSFMAGDRTNGLMKPRLPPASRCR